MGGHAGGLFPGAVDESGRASDTSPPSEKSRSLRELLIAEAQALGLKITPDKVLGIAKQDSGKIIWIETGAAGSRGSGLAHIIEEHGEQFRAKGIGSFDLPAYLIRAVTAGTIVGMQGTRPIYEFTYNGAWQRVAITISRNGYIVGANPRSLPKGNNSENA